MFANYKLLACLAVISVAACSAENDSEPAKTAAEDVADAKETVSGDDVADAGDETDDDLCDAADYQSLVGSNIAAVTLPAELDHRVIAPDTVVTMDYVLTRLNIYTDEDGMITEVKCG